MSVGTCRMLISVFLLLSFANSAGGTSRRQWWPEVPNPRSGVDPYQNAAFQHSGPFPKYVILKSGSGRAGSTEPPEAVLSARCAADAGRVWTGLRGAEEWAVKMVDAAGTEGSGVKDGNTYWLGSYDTCLTIAAPPADRLPNSSFNAAYCLVSITARTRTNYVTSAHLGVCVPESCSPEDTVLLTQLNAQYFGFTYKTLEAQSATCPPRHQPLDIPAITVISILGVLGILVLSGTLHDVIGVRRIWRHSDVISSPLAASYRNYDDDIAPPPEDVTSTGNEAPSYGTFREGDAANEDKKGDGVVGHMTLGSDQQLLSKANANAILEPGHLAGRMLVSFSLYTNCGKLLSVKQTTNELTSLHGLRVFSMSWIMLGNTIFHWCRSFGSLRNTNAVFHYLRRFEFQVGINATLAVDTFFLLSGLLVTYLLLRNMANNGGPMKISWLRFYLHRFWRLTPAYMLVLGVWAAIFKYLGDGPVWPVEGADRWCATNWWTNLLYINNLVHPKHMCMSHSWYLSTDMQYYIFSPVIIVPFFLHWIAGTVVAFVIAGTSIVVVALVCFVNQYPAGTVGFLVDFNNQQGWWVNAFISPWNHVGPYVVGIALGYILYRTECQMKLNKWLVLIGWMLAATCNMAVVYGLYDIAQGNPTSVAVSTVYNCLHRTAWALGVAWVVFACVSGYGGPVQAVLSWRPLVPLSRLTYMAYLIHPMIMQWFYLSRRTPIQWDDGSLIYIYMSHMFVTYTAAAVFSLMLEMPWMALEKALLKRK